MLLIKLKYALLCSGRMTQTGLEQENSQVAVYLPMKTLSILKKEFNISDAEVEGFIASIINKTVVEHMGETNSNVFSAAETNEIENDLKGLGYI